MMFAICVRQDTEIGSSESMPNLANASTEELIDNTIAGWEAANERMYRTEQMAYDLALRASDEARIRWSEVEGRSKGVAMPEHGSPPSSERASGRQRPSRYACLRGLNASRAGAKHRWVN